MLLPLLVLFAFPLFFSSVPLHLPDSSAAVHLSLSSSVFPFSIVLFLLLRSLSLCHSFSSLPHPVALPVAPVTNFPSMSLMRFPPSFLLFLCRLSLLLSLFWVFPLPLLSSVLACRLRLSLRLFLRLSLILPPFLFGVASFHFSGSSCFILWVLLQLHLLSSLLSPCFLSLLLRCLPSLVPTIPRSSADVSLVHGFSSALGGGGGGCLKS